MKIRLDKNGIVKSPSTIKKIMNVPKYMLLFGTMLYGTYVAHEVNQPTIDLPTSDQIAESIEALGASDYYVSLGHKCDMYQGAWDRDNPTNADKIRNKLDLIEAKILDILHSDTKYTRVELPADRDTLTIYVDKDFSDEKYEQMQIVVDEMNAFLQSRAGYKLELHRGVPLLKYLDPYRIIVHKMDADFRSRAGGVTVRKEDNINKMAFCHMLLADSDNVSYFQDVFRHECMHAVFGLGDAYTYEDVITDYVEGMMGSYMQTYDLNTVKLLDALYNTMSSDTTTEERLDALSDFMHSTYAYQKDINKYEDIINDENYDFDLVDQDVIFCIDGNPFGLVPWKSNAIYTSYIEIKDGKVQALSRSQTLNSDTPYILSSDTRQNVDMTSRTYVKDGHIFVSGYLLGFNKPTGKFVTFDMTSKTLTEYNTTILDTAFDDIVRQEEDARTEVEAYRLEHGETMYQSQIADNIKSQLTYDFIAKNLYYKGEINPNATVEYDFDYHAVYRNIYSADTISLHDDVHVCENGVILIGSIMTIVKFDDIYVLVRFTPQADGTVRISSMAGYERTDISLAEHDYSQDYYCTYFID